MSNLKQFTPQETSQDINKYWFVSDDTSKMKPNVNFMENKIKVTSVPIFNVTEIET